MPRVYTLPIRFFKENVKYSVKEKVKTQHWIKSAILDHGFELAELNFILCSDSYLLQINQQYLNHDTLTDIITFDNSDIRGSIMGDIFISIERVQENAKRYRVDVGHELRRILIHGTLHLLGFKDKKKADKLKMTEMENFYLNKFDDTVISN